MEINTAFISKHILLFFFTFGIGMEEVSLHAFLKKCPAAISIVFPVESNRKITAKDVKQSLVFDGKEDSRENQKAAVYFLAYIDEMDLREDGKTYM